MSFTVISPHLDLSNILRMFLDDRSIRGCTPATIRFYENTAGLFVDWCLSRSITCKDLSSRHVRGSLKDEHDRELAPHTIHKLARGIKAFIRFSQHESYLNASIHVPMPKLLKQHHEYLKTKEELQKVFESCLTRRDEFIVTLMIESGLRRTEVVSLNWGDLEWVEGKDNRSTARVGRIKAGTHYMRSV